MALAIGDLDIGAVLSGKILSNLRFADDIAAAAENPRDLQTIVDRIARESSRMGLKINTDKTEVQVISRVDPGDAVISIDGKQLRQVPTFVYLGGKVRRTRMSSTGSD